MLVNIASEIKDFAIDEHNKAVYSSVFDYFFGIEGDLDLKKGLWIEGDIGTGKSTMMRLFSELLKKQFKGFKIYDCTRVSNDYAINCDLDRYTYNQSGYNGEPVNMCFDELGKETIPSIHFGQKLNVMQHILHVRYTLWQGYGVKTFVTTNDGIKDIENKYGSYIKDRCIEMFNFVSMTGKSRRK